MAEVGIAVTRRDLRHKSSLHAQRLALESIDVDRIGTRERVYIHVRQRRGHQLGRGEALVEKRTAAYLIYHLVAHDLARAIVDGILAQHLGRESPVLHDLRRQLHEVALHVGQSAIAHIGEKSVQRVSELVEQRLGLVYRQQGGDASRRTGKVAYDAHHGPNPTSVAISLLGEMTAPRASALARARMEIEVERTQRRFVGVDHLIYLALVVVHWSRQRAERYSVQTIGQKEYAALHVVERQILAHALLLQVVILLADLLGVIPPVPRLEHRVGALVAAKHRQHALQLPVRTLQRWRPHAVEQSVNRLGAPRHLVRGHVIGVRAVPEQRCLLVTQGGHLGHHGLVVVFVAAVAARHVSVVDAVAQGAVLAICQQRQHARLLKREHIFSLASRRLALLQSGVAHH